MAKRVEADFPHDIDIGGGSNPLTVFFMKARYLSHRPMKEIRKRVEADPLHDKDHTEEHLLKITTCHIPTLAPLSADDLQWGN